MWAKLFQAQVFATISFTFYFFEYCALKMNVTWNDKQVTIIGPKNNAMKWIEKARMVSDHLALQFSIVPIIGSLQIILFAVITLSYFWGFLINYLHYFLAAN